MSTSDHNAIASPADHATVPCKFFKLGRCRNGDHCEFSHGTNGTFVEQGISTTTQETKETTETAEAPLRVCTSFLRGSCHFDTECKYQHVLEQPANENQTDISTTDNFQRDFFGATVSFGAGGQVKKVSFPSDFSSARMSGLPLDCTVEVVAQILAHKGFDTPVDCIKIVPIAENSQIVRVVADIRVEDPLFATSLCQRFASLEQNIDVEGKSLPRVSITLMQPNIQASTSASRINCQTVICSWHKPSRMAWVDFGDNEGAEENCEEFHSSPIVIHGHWIQPHPDRDFTDSKWSSILRDIPEETTEEDLATILAPFKPVEIILDTPSYEATSDDIIALVTAELSKIGILESWDLSGHPTSKRVKIRARFQDEASVREAVTQLHLKPLLATNNGRLSVQPTISVKFKITNAVFDAVQPLIAKKWQNWKRRNVHFAEYRNMTSVRKKDDGWRFTVLKIEGQSVQNVAGVKKMLEKILNGTIAKDGDDVLWTWSFGNRSGQQKLNQIAKVLGMAITCDKKKSQVHLYGTKSKVREAQNLIAELVRNEKSTLRIIDLDNNKFQWARHGGFQQIVAALGVGIASIDIFSTPKRIVITGSEENYQAALDMVNSANTSVLQHASGGDDICTICWCPADNPIRTQCGHLYCFECFENMCTSNTNEREFSICCQGDESKCKIVFKLNELQEQLSSQAFENVLEMSATSYICRRPQEFQYCPSPDCEQVFRVNADNTIRTCAKCLKQICFKCHASHPGKTCMEYEAEGLEELKKANGYKDCPKCHTTWEKIDGTCNHMHCKTCGIHFCWVCLETFESSDPCYDHMNEQHGSIGLEIPVDQDGMPMDMWIDRFPADDNDGWMRIDINGRREF